ncbi:hypothetical protein FPOAC1_003739 [Fusarium poae]|uniref:hypothetical protein n=1 Tax=Fusarium poae TaxID=36050 RepID=UPI001CEB7FF3|nr:hypothetical protein FPOAC1_003739 [Fusarium poae]KAG8677711.1 hypothetical protein FPOAC1_003739 [Fusarium poae]
MKMFKIGLRLMVGNVFNVTGSVIGWLKRASSSVSRGLNRVKRTAVENFFKDRPDFIEKLAAKAAAIRDSEERSICEEGLFGKTSQVTLHQQVLYCDDSGSMKDGRSGENRWTAQNELINRIACVSTRILPEGEGIYLRYINKDIPETYSLQLDEIPNIIKSFQPSGYTAIGTNLRTKILEPLVYHKLPNGLTRPLLVTVITDGAPTHESRSAFAEAIAECGNMLVKNGLPRESVKFLIGQVGTASAATAFLQELRKNPDIEDVVFVTKENLDAGYAQWERRADLDRWGSVVQRLVVTGLSQRLIL